MKINKYAAINRARVGNNKNNSFQELFMH